MKSKLIAYAIDFTSYLIQKTKNKDKIKNIILFGSVAREDAGPESDVDLFIDVLDEKKNGQEIRRIQENFIGSSKYRNYWKPLGIENEIKLTIGNLKKWEDLKPSIISNGIVLYGKFKPETNDGKHQTFFIWENIKPNSKRVLFNKQLIGYKQNKKFYPGFLQKYEGKRLGKGCIVVPLEHAKVFQNLFKKYKATVKIKKVLEY